MDDQPDVPQRNAEAAGWVCHENTSCLAFLAQCQVPVALAPRCSPSWSSSYRSPFGVMPRIVPRAGGTRLVTRSRFSLTVNSLFTVLRDDLRPSRERKVMVSERV